MRCRNQHWAKTMTLKLYARKRHRTACQGQKNLPTLNTKTSSKSTRKRSFALIWSIMGSNSRPSQCRDVDEQKEVFPFHGKTIELHSLS